MGKCKKLTGQDKQNCLDNIKLKKAMISASKPNPNPNGSNIPDANKASKYSHVLNSEVGINEKGDFDNIERRTIQGETVPAAKLASEEGGKTKRRSKKSKKSKKKRRTRRKGKKSRKSRK